MSRPIIEVRGISKKYRLGKLGMTSFREEMQNLMERFRGGPDKQPARKEQPADFWALRDVSFDVQPGQAMGIIGRNGAGKSTLLKVLSRITEPTSGEIKIRGRIASLLEVGTGFHPELSGRENVFLNGAILGMTRAEIRGKFDAIVDFAEISQFIDTPVKRYSSGMYVRLAFAVAAHLEPEILIIDEVLAVGDASFQEKCIGKMRDVSLRDGRTVLFVSHNMPTIRSLCTQVVWLKGGQVFQAGDTQPVTEEYLSETAAGKSANGHFESDQFAIDVALLEQPAGREVRGAFFGSNYELSCRIVPKKPVSRAHLLVQIADSGNQVVSSICSREESIPWFRLESALVFRAFLSPLQLLPGNYTVHVFLYDADTGANLVEVRKLLPLHVHEARLPGADIAYNGGHGVARICTGLEMQPA